MTGALLRPHRTRHPSNPLVVDRASPLASKLAFLWVADLPFKDLATGKLASLSGTLPVTSTDAAGRKLQGANVGNISFGTRSEIGATGVTGFTMFAIWYIRSNTNSAATGAIFGNTQSTFNIGIGFGGDEQMFVTFTGTPLAARWPATSNANFFSNNGYTFRPVPVCVTWDGTNIRYYVEGKLTTTTAFSTAFTTTSDTFSVLSRGDTGNRLSNVDTHMAACWNRCLSANEAEMLCRNPWQLFKPRQRVSWLNTLSGTLFTKSLAGSITKTGSLATAYTASRSVSGSITPSGIIAKATSKFFSGSMTMSGVVTKATSKMLAGSLTLSAIVNKATSRLLAGTMTLSGALGKAYSTTKAASGVITLAASIASQLYHAAVGGLVSRYYTLRRFLGRR
jgi:Concanavalin A-like lectin/glucanases superfamily